MHLCQVNKTEQYVCARVCYNENLQNQGKSLILEAFNSILYGTALQGKNLLSFESKFFLKEKFPF